MRVVVGAGEVGTALAEVLEVDHVRDVAPMDPVVAEVMHVAIPWSGDFTEIVQGYEQEYQADLVVVHSTVPVGTCDPHGWVHSPVRGRHPHLVESLTVFPKLFGGERAGLAAKDWPGESATFVRAAELEAGKLWELVQFGLQVKVNQAIHEWCIDQDLDGDLVYRLFAETYNQGYSKLGEDRFVRPVLDYQPGPIGGHCVVPNSRLVDHPLARLVAE